MTRFPRRRNRGIPVFACAALLAPTAFAAPASPAANNLYTRCDAMRLVVLPLGEEEVAHGLSHRTIRFAVESRLRAARLYRPTPRSGPLELRLLVSVVDGAFSVTILLQRTVANAGLGFPGHVGLAMRPVLGVHANDPAFVTHSLSELMDRFLVEYLRANEQACAMKDRGNWDGLLTLEGVGLARDREIWPDLTDAQLEHAAWMNTGLFRILTRAEFHNQYVEARSP